MTKKKTPKKHILIAVDPNTMEVHPSYYTLTEEQAKDASDVIENIFPDVDNLECEFLVVEVKETWKIEEDISYVAVKVKK